MVKIVKFPKLIQVRRLTFHFILDKKLDLLHFITENQSGETQSLQSWEKDRIMLRVLQNEMGIFL